MQTDSRYPWGKGTPKVIRDNTDNDSSKDFTPGTNKIWLIKSITVKLASTATVGNRLVGVQIFTGGDQYLQWGASFVQAASNTYYYSFAPGGLNTSGSASGYNNCTMPEMVVPYPFFIRVKDLNNVDAAADDMYVGLNYIEYDA